MTVVTEPLLRVALVTRGAMLAAWLTEAINSLENNQEILVVKVCSLDDERTGMHLSRLETLYYRLYEMAESFRNVRDFSATGGAIDARSRYPGAVVEIPGSFKRTPTMGTRQFDDLDLIINCGVSEIEFKTFCGTTAALSYSFSGMQSDLSLFRAMIHGDANFFISINLIEDNRETQIEYARPALPKSPGFRDFKCAAHRSAAVVFAKAVRVIAKGKGIAHAAAAPLVPQARRVDTLSMVRYLFRRSLRSFRGRLVRLRPDLFWLGDDFNWFLAYRTKSADFVCNTNKFRADGFKLLLPPIDKFYADPIAIRHKGVDHVFFEEWFYKTNKGVISWMQMNSDGSFSDPEVILQESHHLSYPFIFEADNFFYMIPESAAAASVNLYKAIEFPRRWEKVATLLENVAAVDATVIQHEGRWWMFASVAENGFAKTDRLHLYFADTLAGPWQAHQDNPVKIDVRSARPAGRLFKRNGKLIRPSQDCSVTYGGALTLNEIIHLSPERFVESAVETLLPDWLPFNVGFHTLTCTETLEVIDGRMRAHGKLRFPKVAAQQVVPKQVAPKHLTA